MHNERPLSFTYSYNQPDEYRFSLDSIYLARFVASQLRNRINLESLKVLDLCAGCGVIGIELSYHLQRVRQIDFIEVQDIYTDYFYQNLSNIHRPELTLSWYLLNYDALHEIKWKNKYDLIVSNPPYFHPEHGMLSPSTFKNRCRFFLDSTFRSYILALINSLAVKGSAYFLLRPAEHHGMDLFSDIKKIINSSITIQKISTIRGTDIILLEKIAPC